MTEENNPVFQGLRALVVDPDPEFVRSMKEHLESFGFEVRTAFSRNDAEALAEKIPFHLVTSEILLEEPDGGFILAWHLRKRFPELRIVLISAVSFRTGFHFDLSDPEARAWICADEILDKEIRFEQLEHLLVRFFRSAFRPFSKAACFRRSSLPGFPDPDPPVTPISRTSSILLGLYRV